jgi:hypothetical protein
MDGVYPAFLSETSKEMFAQQRISGADFTVMPPLNADGTGEIVSREDGGVLTLELDYFIDGTLSTVFDATIRADLVLVDGTTIRGDDVNGLGYFTFDDADQLYKLDMNTPALEQDETLTQGVRYVVERPNVADDPDFQTDRLLVVDTNDTILTMEGPDGELCTDNLTWPCDDVIVTVRITFENPLDIAGIIDLLIEEGGDQPPVKIEGAIDSLVQALEKLDDDQLVGAFGSVEGAMGDIGAGMNNGDIDVEFGTFILQKLAEIAREFAIDTINTYGSTSITDALLAEGDVLLADGDYKQAVSKYKAIMAELTL